MLKIKFMIIIVFLINLNASVNRFQSMNPYYCKVDTVKNTKTGEIASIPKKEWIPVKMIVKSNEVLFYLANNKSPFILPFYETQKLMSYLETDIYYAKGFQLEIIDISKSYKTGGRFFIPDKNRMYTFTYCKNTK